MTVKRFTYSFCIILFTAFHVFSQNTYIPDDNFEQALIDLGLDSGILNDSVPTINIDTVTFLNVDRKNIEDLTGIENFVSLTKLACSHNNLTELNLSFNAKLEMLGCAVNKLVELDLSSVTNLQSISCSNNKLIDLDLSFCPNLTYLYCVFNQLSGLNIQNGNNNNLRLYAYNNPNLFCIQVDDTYTAYTSNDWYKNEFTAYSEDCSTYDPDNLEMTYVPDDNFEQYLIHYNLDSGPLNDSVPTVKLRSVETLNIPMGEIEDLTGIEDFWNLSELHCSGNNLTILDLSNNKKLTYLTCYDNNIETLDLSNNSLLYNLTCYQNNISTLDLSANTLLSYLQCDNNQLTDLDVSKCEKLLYLSCPRNQLEFNDLEPIFALDQSSNFTTFSYAPQDSIGSENTMFTQVSDSITIHIDGYTPAENDLYQWFKNDSILTGETDSTLTISEIKLSDAGVYHCAVNNTIVSGLTLYSHPVQLIVPSSGIPLTEYNALVDFYDNLNGSNWLRNDNWLDTINHTVNDWFGITVEDGHVTKINFDAYNNYNLNGNIPNSIRNLTGLKGIAFVSENVSGTLPSGLFELASLEELVIAECQISGNIPSEIGNLTNLKKLGLEANQMDGNIPAELGDLANLEFLSLFANNMSGEIPSSLGQLSNLYYLGLAYNQLDGNIPASLGNLNNLQWLLLSNNKLSGAIHSELANLTDIVKFTFENNLIGSTQAENKSAMLKSGTIENNRQIPDELAGLIEMDTFRIANNNLQFNDIEAIFSWDNFNSFNEFIYNPQDSIGISKTVEGETGKSVTLSLENYYPGTSDTYQWYKNNVAISNATSSELLIEHLEENDEGKYYCIVSNPVAEDLQLTSRAIALNVQTVVGTDYSDLSQIEIYPNPAKNQVYVKTNNKIIGLKVFDLSGKLVLQKKDFSSQWINIDRYPKGTYLFHLIDKQSKSVIQKVVFK